MSFSTHADVGETLARTIRRGTSKLHLDLGRPGLASPRPHQCRRKRMIRKLISGFRVGHIPRLLDLIGFACIITAVGITFGLAPALAVVGIACLVVGWALE
jgi:hypothetical protein